MTYVLSQVYSLPFFSGAVVGFTCQRIYCAQKARWQDRHHPLPDGTKRSPEHISRIWIAGLAAVLSLGYVLLTTNKTHDETLDLTRDVARCWQESYQATRAQIKINAENDVISRQQQGLQREFDRATSDWLKSLIAPPGDLAEQDTNSPARKAWGLEVTGQYQGKLNELGARSDELVDRRNDLDSERAKHPLREVTCGK
jgi:hypothetical protein